MASSPEFPRRRRPWIFWLSSAFALFSVSLVLLARFLAEDAWGSMLLTFLPLLPLLVPGLTLLIASAVRRDLRAGLLDLFALILLANLDGFQIDFQGRKRAVMDAAVYGIESFNIQHGWGNLHAVAKELRIAAPRLVAFQEAGILREGQSGREILAAALPNHTIVATDGPALSTDFRIVRTWEPGFRVPERTWALFAELESEESGRFVFASVHLNPVQWDRFFFSELGKLPDHLRSAARVRERQVESLLEEVAKIPKETPVILCGDFNGPPRGRWYSRITAVLQDAFDEAGTGFGWTIPSGLPVTRLDYVFVRKNHFVRDAYVGPPSGSDHRPLRAFVGY